jgi:hypothetical protein
VGDLMDESSGCYGEIVEDGDETGDFSGREEG